MNTFSSTELTGTTETPVAVLEYRDMSARNLPAQSPLHVRGGAEKGEGSAASKHSATEIASLVEREKATTALEVEQRLHKLYEQKLLAERNSIAKLIAGFEEQRSEYFASVEAEIVQLALSIAAKILHRESQVDPMLVAALVRIAVEKIREGSSVIVRVSSKHADSWRKFFAESSDTVHVEVVADMSLNDQDCIVATELGFANFGLDTQLKEVEQGFFDLLALRPTSR